MISAVSNYGSARVLIFHETTALLRLIEFMGRLALSAWRNAREHLMQMI